MGLLSSVLRWISRSFKWWQNRGSPPHEMKPLILMVTTASAHRWGEKNKNTTYLTRQKMTPKIAYDLTSANTLVRTLKKIRSWNHTLLSYKNIELEVLIHKVSLRKLTDGYHVHNVSKKREICFRWTLEPAVKWTTVAPVLLKWKHFQNTKGGVKCKNGIIIVSHLPDEDIAARNCLSRETDSLPTEFHFIYLFPTWFLECNLCLK